MSLRRLSSDEVALLRRQIVRVAQGNLGFGETEANNRGPFLRAIGAPDGAEWCAYFARYTVRRGAQYAELHDWDFVGSGNAKRLGLAIAATPNGFVTRDLALVVPGDFVVLHRGDSPYTGHVRVVEDVNGLRPLPQIEGNSGRYPAVVRRRATNPLKERLVAFYGFR